MLITLKPSLAKLLISPRESQTPFREESLDFLDKKIQEGNWDDVPPIWITPNFLLNSLYNSPTLKPFIMYNGHHRLESAIKYSLPIKAYVRYTPGNQKMPEDEKLHDDFAG